MKAFALVACAAILLVAGAAGTTASASSHVRSSGAGHLSLRVVLPTMRGLQVHRATLPFQTGGSDATATPVPATGTATTTTPTAGPTATPVPTVSPYPDPVTLLNDAITKYENITNVHFENIINGVQTNVEKITVDATGVANCSSEQANVKGTDSVPGTAQKKTIHYLMIVKGKAFYKRQLVNDKTHKQWRKVKENATYAFGTFSIDNPLACPTPSNSGGGTSSGGSDVLRDMVNLGPVTYHGVATWHIRATEISTAADGTTSEALLEFYISQSQTLPYGYRVTINDPDHNVTLTFEQILTQFGKKVKIPTPKVGATTP